MSYQAQAFARNVSGITRGEKSLLVAIGYYHDSRTGECRASQEELASDCIMTERHVRRLTSSLEHRGVIHCKKGNGAYQKTSFEFIGMPVKISKKADICDTKGGHLRH